MSALSVLEDAILWQGGELPDELCPLYLVDAGRRLGGDAAAVAEKALAEHREEWFGSYDPDAIWRELAGRRGKKKLRWVHVAEAVRFQAESVRQIVEAWGPEVREALTTYSPPAPGGPRGFGHLQTLSRAKKPLTGVFAVGFFGHAHCWVGDQQEARVMRAPMHSSVLPLERGAPLPAGWEHCREFYGPYVRDWQPPTAVQRSRKARDAARASRQAEAEMVVGVAR